MLESDEYNGNENYRAYGVVSSDKNKNNRMVRLELNKIVIFE